MPHHKSRILIVGPAWVGDMVMAQTLFKQLRHDRPYCIIDVLAPAWTQPLLNRMPEVNEAIASPFRHGQLALWQRYQLGRSLRARQYDEAIVLPGSFKAALVPFWAKIPKRVGWLGEMRYGVLTEARPLNKQLLPKMIQRFIALALQKNASLPEQPLLPKLVITSNSVTSSLAALGIERPQKPVLALCPGAEFGTSKRWPPTYYAEIAQQQLQQGWQVWVFGSAKDREVGEEINQQCGGKILNLAGRTSLTQAIDLLSLATVVISNDSGLMHVAASIGRPLVVVYGSSSPDFTPPLSDDVRILRTDLPCSPCFKRECPLKHHHCMSLLKPNIVFDALQSLVPVPEQQSS